MKLNPKGVEKAEAAMALANPYSETYAEDRVIAAFTAYFDHLREAGLMRDAAGINVNLRQVEDWQAVTWANDGDFYAAIIRTDKE